MNLNTSPKIKILPEFLINQIKAGEVIESPANLIKELIENSIDAQSSRVEIQIINNGLDLISIKDNGIGIEFAELPYAFCRHATSKIRDFSDLYKLNSFGFRGEALASIASVSKLRCQSTPATGTGGAIEFEGGVELSHYKIDNSQTGTQTVIKELFYNTPVRLKFVRSEQSQKNEIRRILDAYILNNPNIEFIVKWNNDEPSVYKNTTYINRVNEVLGSKYFGSDKIINLSKEYNSYSVLGLVSKEPLKSHGKKYQFIFVNNRPVQDISLHHLITNSMKAFWPHGSSGAYIISLKIPAQELDVNIHPQKTRVKYENSSIVLSMISAAIKEALKNLNIPREETTFKRFDTDASVRGYQGRDDSTYDHSSTFLVNSSFMILKNEDKVFLIHIKKLLQTYLKNNFSDNKEQTKIPLLISLPFEASSLSKDKLNELSIKGFEFDRIGASSYLLRSVPSYIEFLPFQEIIPWLIFDKDWEEQTLSNLSYKQIMEIYDSTPNAQSFSIELKDDNLDSFFNE